MKTIDFNDYLNSKLADPKFKKGFDKEYQKLKDGIEKKSINIVFKNITQKLKPDNNVK